ncbi:MAG: DNA-3-methyladenine glycosylase [Candidatus Diapherotrites archaeon]|nr:DNA-3-methyladenine glycosylase [Candidatus Diapherotrites archaeon]
MIEGGKILGKPFFERDTVQVATELIGKNLWCGKCVGRIVETEAYLGENDAASHASRKSAREKGNLMFGQPGNAYVYFTYGNHWMFNVVTEKNGTAGAVLIRALEPLQGIGLMEKRRGTRDLHNLCSGPGKLCQALAINGSFHGLDLTKPQSKIFVAGTGNALQVVSSLRVGISKGTEHAFRFFEKESRFVSGKKLKY